MDDACRDWKRRALRAEQQLARQQRIVAHQREQLRIRDAGLEHYRLKLTALWYVWCSGGCRADAPYTMPPLTQALIEEAVRNTSRLIVKYANLEEYGTMPPGNFSDWAGELHQLDRLVAAVQKRTA